MKKTISFLLLAFLLFAFFGCSSKEDPRGTKHTDPAEAEIHEFVREWSYAIKTHDMERFISLMPVRYRTMINELPFEMAEELKAPVRQMFEAFDELADIEPVIQKIDFEDAGKTRAIAHLQFESTASPKNLPLSTSQPIPLRLVKEDSEWKLYSEGKADTKRKGLTISVSYKDSIEGYHIFFAEAYNEGKQTESISPGQFVLVTDSDESIEGEVPLKPNLVHYRVLQNFHILPDTWTSGYIFFRTRKGVKRIVYVPTGTIINVSTFR